MITLYCLLFPNGKRYIGQTINVYHRMHSHKAAASKTQIKLCRAIRKYKFKNIQATLLAEMSTQNEIDMLEIMAIEYFNSINNGYNITPGGDFNPTALESVRIKLREYRARPEITEKYRIIMKSTCAKQDFKKKRTKALSSKRVRKMRSEQMKAFWSDPEWKHHRLTTTKHGRRPAK